MPFVVVDMWAGRYINTNVGHEGLNMVKNPIDGRFYGYCPPNGTLYFPKLGAKSTDKKVTGVIVIYTQRQKQSANRDIIGFCVDATIHKELQDGKALNRMFNGVCCGYSVESDNMYEILSNNKFEITTFYEGRRNRFRGQRFYKGQYPDLDKKIINYIKNYIDGKDSDEDFTFQEDVQNEIEKVSKKIENSSKSTPKYSNASGSNVVAKNPRISKQALETAGYKCVANAKHETFTASHGNPYMEGHHLIPCTFSNSELYWKTKKRNIDCEENIVCLCPTCHRRIHFGAAKEKQEIIELLYNKYKEGLKKVGLDVTLKELLALYNLL